jgi:hypothetical protein
MQRYGMIRRDNLEPKMRTVVYHFVLHSSMGAFMIAIL